LRTNFNFAGLFSHAGENSNTVTSRTLATSLRQDILITPRDFVFGLGQFEHISTQGLYLRQTYGGGFGTDIIQNSRTTFSLAGGMTYQHEKFITGAWAQNASPLLGEKLGEQVTKRTRIDHSLTFYPNFSQWGEYRFDSTTALNIKLTTRISFNASLIDLFLSNPPAGHQRNNVTFSTGIGYAF
jgi:putative salt-induced outer membrane protein YdiY